MQSPQSMLATIIIRSLPHRALILQRPINRSAPSSRDLKKKKTANEILHEIIAVIFLLPGQIIRREKKKKTGSDTTGLLRMKKGH